VTGKPKRRPRKPAGKPKAAKSGSKRAALKRAEQAVLRLSAVFEDVVRASVEQMRRLCAGWPETADGLYRLAHDLKGQGTSFGYPAITAIAGELCRDIEARHDPDIIEAHLKLISQALKRPLH
jgi:HPt (histidine-containing phosphotransfer) domain-containing protein